VRQLLRRVSAGISSRAISPESGAFSASVSAISKGTSQAQRPGSAGRSAPHPTHTISVATLPATRNVSAETSRRHLPEQHLSGNFARRFVHTAPLNSAEMCPTTPAYRRKRGLCQSDSNMVPQTTLKLIRLPCSVLRPIALLCADQSCLSFLFQSVALAWMTRV
jgi:hypothetical protein